MTMTNRVARGLLLLALLKFGNSQTTTSGCHFHGTVEYCIVNGVETPVNTDTDSSRSAEITSARESPSVTTTPNTAAAGVLAGEGAQTTALTDCHLHDATQYCLDGFGSEFAAQPTGDATTTSLPSSYTGCHPHGAEAYCYGPDSEETLFVAEAAAAATTAPTEAGSASSGRSCHFHAGVEHCVGGSSAEVTCERVDRDYNIPLRIGTLFAILLTSCLGALAPLFLARFSAARSSFTVVKQFGTGVIISTALVHLLTHAQLMFANECLGELSYESTATAIAIAGAFLIFVSQYLSLRIFQRRIAQKAQAADLSQPVAESKECALMFTSYEQSQEHVVPIEDKITVWTLELGIIFHSIILGVTLVVAGDSAYIVLFIVIMFHQAFEGLALGARIAALTDMLLLAKCTMAICFAVTTPIGMAIGIGVLDHFNGNDKSTIVAIGTLDSFSAGILLWNGFVSMWAHDWLYGELRNAGLWRTVLSMLSLVSGIILMSLLGKWA